MLIHADSFFIETDEIVWAGDEGEVFKIKTKCGEVISIGNATDAIRKTLESMAEMNMINLGMQKKYLLLQDQHANMEELKKVEE